MKNQLPYGGDRVAENTARTDRVMGNGYKSGGSVKSDEAGTKISITIGGPPTQDKQNQGLAGLAALAQAAKPPMPPPMMGAPPPGPGGPGAPPPMGMKRGGKVPGGRLDKAPRKAEGGSIMSAPRAVLDEYRSWSKSTDPSERESLGEMKGIAKGIGMAAIGSAGAGMIGDIMKGPGKKDTKPTPGPTEPPKKKQGGAANMDAGAGGGKGRLEKAGMK